MGQVRGILGSAATVAGLVAPAAAAEGWPAVTPNLPAGWQGEGGGLAILPAVAWWGCVLIWIRTVDWVHSDATKHGIAPALWSTICGLPLPLVALAAWWIPSIIAGIVLMLLAWIVPVGLYARFRNARLGVAERILTPGHARRIVAGLLAPLGIEIGEPMSQDDLLPTVDVLALGGKDEAENTARLSAANALPGFEELRKQMLAAVVARAATAVVDVAAETSVRHEVDGVWGKPRVLRAPRTRKEKEAWVEAPPSSRDVGEAILAAAQAIAGLPAAANGSGRFMIKVDGKPRHCRLTMRPSVEGKQLVVQIDSPDAAFKSLATLGMAEPLAKRIGELLASKMGLLILSSPSGAGLSTTFDLIIESADRLLRDFISVEDAARPPREIQNVKPVRFDARTGVTPLAALADAMREYPAAIVSRDVRDKGLVAELVRLVGEDKLVILSLKASDAVDALSRIMASGVDPKSLGGALLGSVSQRLIRRLCPKCREDIETPELLLAKARLSIEQLPHIRKASEHGCRLCQGSGYLGRTGIFELASGGTLRKLVAARGSSDQLRKEAVQDGMRPLRDAALQLVIDGVTSLEEIQRAFASNSADAAASPQSVTAKGRSGPATRGKQP